ncbi:MAG: hypothetical protein ACKVVP_05540, partial [Chloroflexota bacterium]
STARALAGTETRRHRGARCLPYKASFSDNENTLRDATVQKSSSPDSFGSSGAVWPGGARGLVLRV